MLISKPGITVKPENKNIYTNQLISIFDYYLNEIEILSLDCFDTLIWRTVHEPKDVFYELANQPYHKKIGCKSNVRVNIENHAYEIKQLKNGSRQATLRDIYSINYPHLDHSFIDQLIEEEINCELKYFFAFSPMVDLIKYAKKNRKKIIIVSDTYFESILLKRILSEKLTPEVFSMIDDVFCSCDYGTAKHEALFNSVKKKMRVNFKSIFHLGDNYTSDYERPRSLGIQSFHFQQTDYYYSEVLRTLPISTCFVDSTVRKTRPLTVFTKGLSAYYARDTESKNIFLGVAPILYAFGRYIINEIRRIESSGKKLKVAFLLRDAYLPFRACKVISSQKDVGHLVRVSRFASFASSFRSKSDVEKYLASRVKSKRFNEICKQLLIDKKDAEKITHQAKQSPNPIESFCNQLLQDKILNKIFSASKEYRKRFIKYLNKELSLERDDTLMFVDLGYTGNAQINLEPVLKEELGVDVIGRYLLSLKSASNYGTQEGLLDGRHYDEKSIVMLVTYIALFEQICTCTEASIIDYDIEGNPVFSNIRVDESQFEKVRNLQENILSFIGEFDSFFEESGVALSGDDLRDIAASHLSRLLFLPTESEILYFNDFTHDVNLGTDDIVKMFDINKGLLSLQQRGWLNSLKEAGNEMRMHYPAEWRAIGLELLMTLMAQHLFDFKLTMNDLTFRKETLEIIVMSRTDSGLINVEAIHTFDGYYAINIPVVEHSKIGVRFGLKFTFLEILSIYSFDFKFFYSNKESTQAIDVSSDVLLDQINLIGNQLYQCASKDGLLIYSPRASAPLKHILRIIFRPF